MTTREELLDRIRALSFAKDEVVIYLDGHPHNRQALAYFYDCLDKLTALRDEYEGRFGPLTVEGVHSDKSWSWIRGPWPWQREEDYADMTKEED